MLKVQLFRIFNVYNNMNLLNIMAMFKDYIKPLSDGRYELTIPRDLSNPSKDNSDTVVVDQNGMNKLYNVYTQPKAYQDSNNRIIHENDSDFDMNKWYELVIKHLKS